MEMPLKENILLIRMFFVEFILKSNLRVIFPSNLPPIEKLRLLFSKFLFFIRNLLKSLYLDIETEKQIPEASHESCLYRFLFLNELDY
jgi:hypothetical protein